MIREGLIIQVKNSGSRKKSYRLIKNLIDTYETNFKRIFANFEAGFAIPSEIEELYHELANSYPQSPSLNFFWKYLETYTQSGQRILQLMKSFSLKNEKIIPRFQIEESLRYLSIQFLSQYYKSDTFLDRQQNDKIKEPDNLMIKLNALMEKYFEFFQILMQKLERNVNAGLVLNCFFINYYPLTQDRLIELTKVPRSTLSNLLNEFIQQRLVVEMEIPGERCKYYHIAFPREIFLLGKQLKSLQITLQLEKILHDHKLKLLQIENSVFNEKKSAILEYLSTTEIAFGRMNTQMLKVVEELASDIHT